MNAVKATGVFISAIGVVLVLNFFTRQVNPDVQGADLGMLAILLGLLTVDYDSLRKRVGGHGATSAPLVSAGWPILSAGLLSRTRFVSARESGDVLLSGVRSVRLRHSI